MREERKVNSAVAHMRDAVVPRTGRTRRSVRPTPVELVLEAMALMCALIQSQCSRNMA